MSLKVPRQRALSVVRTLIRERNEARAKLATTAAAATDAAKARDEAERELRDALAELDAVREALRGYHDSDLASLAETLVAQRRLLAEELIQIPALEVDDKALNLAQSILEEDGNE